MHSMVDQIDRNMVIQKDRQMDMPQGSIINRNICAKIFGVDMIKYINIRLDAYIESAQIDKRKDERIDR